MSLCDKRGHLTSYHGNEATLINGSCLLITVMKSHQNLFNYVSLCSEQNLVLSCGKRVTRLSQHGNEAKIQTWLVNLKPLEYLPTKFYFDS